MLPPYWKQDSKLLPDPINNYSGYTNIIPKGSYEAVDLKFQVGESGLVSIIDSPTSLPTHDGLFYIARTGTSTWQIDTIASRQVVLSVIGGQTVIENKGTTNEQYKWAALHLI